MIVGQDGPAVVISARTAAWLEKYADLSRLRVRVRGTDPEISRALEELRAVAMSWRSSVTGTEDDRTPEPAARSGVWLSCHEAADLAGVGERAIRKAIAEGRLPASQVGRQWQINREDVEHYRAARAARAA